MMNLKSGYSPNIVKENVKQLSEIVDLTTALSVASSYARACFKLDRPDSTAFPEHLRPGNVRAAMEDSDG